MLRGEDGPVSGHSVGDSSISHEVIAWPSPFHACTPWKSHTHTTTHKWAACHMDQRDSKSNHGSRFIKLNSNSIAVIIYQVIMKKITLADTVSAHRPCYSTPADLQLWCVCTTGGAWSEFNRLEWDVFVEDCPNCRACSLCSLFSIENMSIFKLKTIILVTNWRYSGFISCPNSLRAPSVNRKKQTKSLVHGLNWPACFGQ